MVKLAATTKLVGLLIVACFFGARICSAQVAYSRVIPYDPRYLIRRVPVRRSAESEGGIRLPIARYFPQVDPQIVSAPYLTPEAVAPAAYRLTNGEIYAVPSKWAEDVIPVSPLERNEDNEYDTYEYDNEYAPAYARGYPKEIERDSEGDLYNDMMVNYLLGEMQPAADVYPEVQRRSETFPRNFAGNNEIVDETKRENASKDGASVSTTASPDESSPKPSQEVSSAAAVAEPSTSTPAVSRKVVNFDKVQRFPNEYVVGSFPAQKSMWETLNTGIRAQNEMPITRPKPSFASLESHLSRSKNKEALPIIEKLMSAAHHSDPLKEQLDSLRFRNM